MRLEKFPDSVRFHPGIYSRQNEAMHPALLVVAKDSADQVQAVQAIFLDKETAQKADVPSQKTNLGSSFPRFGGAGNRKMPGDHRPASLIWPKALKPPSVSIRH